MAGRKVGQVFREKDHPRAPAGASKGRGGEFVEKGGGLSPEAEAEARRFQIAFTNRQLAKTAEFKASAKAAAKRKKRR